MNNEKTEKKLLTVALASKLLDTVPDYVEDGYGQRSVSDRVVKSYAEQMKAGNWKETYNDALVIDTNNNLINGQHRCWAVVESGVSIPVSIVRNADPEVIHYIDKGRNRTVADDLKIHGHRYSPMIASALRYTHIFRKGWLTASGSGSKYTYDDAMKDIGSYPEMNILAEKIGSGSTFAFTSYMPNALGLALWCHIKKETKANDEKVDLFFERVIEGLDLKKTYPENMLRNTLMRMNMKKLHKPKPIHVASLTIYAWNRRAENRMMKHLSWGGKKFPTVK